MSYEQIVQIVQAIIQSVQNAGITVGREVRRLSKQTLSVRVENPQSQVEVTGNVSVDQSKTEAALKNNALAIRELKNALKPLKEVKVSNFPVPPKFPKFPEFPKGFKVLNFPAEMKISNMRDVVVAIQKMCNQMGEMDMAPKVTVEAPVVNVPAPIVNVPKQPAPVVNVEAPDMSDIKKIIDFLDAIGVKKPLAVRLSDGQKFYKALERMADIYAGSSSSSFQNSDGSEGRGMLNRNSEMKVTVNDTWDANDVDKVSTTLTYFGEETIDGAWRVRKVTKSGTLTAIRHATVRNNEAITSYEAAWTAREDLEYGYAREL